MNTQHCRSCVYATVFEVGAKIVLMCANRPDRPGQPVCVPPDGCCRCFCAAGQRRVQRQGADPPAPPNDNVRYISLTRGRYAIVDAVELFGEYAYLNFPEDYGRVHEYQG